MSSSNGRTKRSVEHDGRRQRRQTGAQTDRQTMQALELIRRAFSGLDARGGPWQEPVGQNAWEGHMPADTGRNKTFWLRDEAVNHFGDVGSAWPYDAQSSAGYSYGPEDQRGRRITLRAGAGVDADGSEFPDGDGPKRRSGGYHSMRGGLGHSSGRYDPEPFWRDPNSRLI